MKLHMSAIATVSLLAFYCNPLQAQGSPCPYNSQLTCTIERDILNDMGSNGLRYYAPTNYNHTISGEIELYNSNQVFPYTDSTDAPGQLELLMKNNNGSYISGEVMTRVNLNLPPYNAPVASNRWTTQEISHGYLEVTLKMPECQTSSDGVCNKGNPPNNYSEGFWPSIWMLPTMDTNWPENGEIDISEAYKLGTNYNVSTATLHFNGTSPDCNDGNCVNDGYSFANSVTSTQLWTSFHTWGFEWQPDPKSTDGGQIIAGYFDNVLAWGPVSTDSLPADGPGAFSRGFNDPNGGFYLIVAFAVGGPYAGAPIPLALSAGMYLQSAKAYTVSATPPPPCLPPADIQSSYTADKKNITLTWQAPANSDTILNYQVSNWQNNPMWTGTATTFTDNTLPGTNGTFTYYLYSNCPSGLSAGVQVNVVISNPLPCLPPANIESSFTADKKSITLAWQQPANSAPILNYQVNNWLNDPMWTGTTTTFTDNTLPGTNGNFVYYLYSRCATGLSSGVEETVVINLNKLQLFNTRWEHLKMH